MNGASPRGRITSGITAGAAALKTLEFIELHLPAWRDDPERSRAERERELNSQLSKYLNVAARKLEFAMVHFSHEEPQGVQHSADLSANELEAGWIEGRQYTKYEPFLVLEGKRLPTPGSGREREYISSAAGKKPSGGMQRFKLGLHGGSHARPGMIAYVQGKTCKDWFAQMNHWIEELALSGAPQWSVEDRINRFEFNATVRLSRCDSVHSRSAGASPKIRLTHLWVEM